MKIYVKINANTGAVERVSPVMFEGSEELEFVEDHPFLQELMQGMLPTDWKHVDGEIKKTSLPPCTYITPPKINLRNMIVLKSHDQNNKSWVWQTPWQTGLFFITEVNDSWRVLKIFEIESDGTFVTDQEQFQLFSITHNDSIWKSLEEDKNA